MSLIGNTMLVGLMSVATTATIGAVGVYLHRRQFVVEGAKKTLARLSQQVTIPALLFTNLVTCYPSPDGVCPSITDSFADGVWLMLVWPLYVVAIGLFVGWLAAILSKTPKSRQRVVFASCAFGNSSGLPITLLGAITASVPATSPLLQTDPVTLIAVYMIMFPVLQWGLGGIIMEPEEKKIEKDQEPEQIAEALDETHQAGSSVVESVELGLPPSASRGPLHDKSSTIVSTSAATVTTEEATVAHASSTHYRARAAWTALVHMAKRIALVVSKFAQPPVIGAVLGIIVSSMTPVRGIFVDVQGTGSTVPLGWFFNGLVTIGGAAVPVNMTILGINLSMAVGTNNPFRRKKTSNSNNNTLSSSTTSSATPALPDGAAADNVGTTNDEVVIDSKNTPDNNNSLSVWTIIATVVGKMIVMPAVGIASGIVFHTFMTLPPHLEGAFYLVLMVVFITPTANNLMVMVELSGSGSQQDMAQLIAWQYAVAPVFMSLSIAVIVMIAS